MSETRSRSNLVVIGIDPGIVNTGVVVLRINQRLRVLRVEQFVFSGNESHPEQVRQLMEDLNYPTKHVFIEKYRERGKSYAENPRMRALESDFRALFPQAVFVDNTGIKKVVTPQILAVFGMDSFPTTHHQDLESAARVLLLGMLRNEEMNKVCYDIVADEVRGVPWLVTTV